MTKQRQATRKKTWRWIVLATLLLFAVFAVLWFLDQQNKREPVAMTEQSLPVVTVIEAKAKAHRARVSALSEAKARNVVELRTQSAGQIVSLNEDFLPGKKVYSGSILLQIQNDAEKTMVAEAGNRLAHAKLALLTEERKAVTAAENWKISAKGEAAASPLVLRQPQLEVARAEQRAAAASVKEAELQLANTAIRVPFDGIIDRRDVSLGETVASGQAIGLIVDQETIDVTVHLNSNDWQLLPNKLDSLEVSLRDPASGQIWLAHVRASSGVIDDSTRMRRLYLVHQRDPSRTTPLLPGTFVQVLIPGIFVGNTLQVPESALTRDGTIWSVDENGVLLRHEAKRVFSRDGSAFVQIAGLGSGDVVRVALHPLAGFIVGDRVEARVAEVME